MSERVRAIHEALAGADIQAEAVERRADADLGEVHLSRLARRIHRRGAAADRRRLGRIRSSARSSSTAAARSSGWRAPKACPVAADIIERIAAYVGGIPGTMRSSLLIDLSQGKRIEVEALQGAVVRRAARAGVAGADHVDAVCGAEAMGGTPTRLSIAS